MLPMLLIHHPGLFGEHPKPFGLPPGVFFYHAVIFCAIAFSVGLLADVFSPFPAVLSLDPFEFRGHCFFGMWTELDNRSHINVPYQTLGTLQ